MNWDAVIGNIPLILFIILLIALQVILGRRNKRPARTNPEIVQSLLIDVKMNQALVEMFQMRPKPKNFETGGWRTNKSKVGFLDQPLQVVLADAFGIAEDLNQQIRAAKKSKSSVLLANVNVNKLNEPLAKSKEGLEQWLQTNIGRKNLPPKYPGLLDMFFGSRD